MSANIGDTWKLEYRGKIFYITLEVWNYGQMYKDGSGHEFDWTTSYKKARSAQSATGKFKKTN